ncbi:hypothetical protein Tco_1130708 [Tanacetum coccineum]
MSDPIQDWYVGAEGENFDMNTVYVLKNLGYESDEEVIFHYKILLKSLDTRLKPLISESDIGSMLGYVYKHKIMCMLSMSKTQKEHIVDEVEVNMSGFKFQLDGEGKVEFVDPIEPWVTIIEDDLEVLDFDSLESDLENVPENARSKAVIEDAQEDKTSGPWVVQEQMQKEFYVGVSKTKAFRAKAKAQVHLR